MAWMTGWWPRRPGMSGLATGAGAVALLLAILGSAAPVRDDFVHVPFPRLADASNRQVAAAVESYKREAAIVDPRLSCQVTLQFKATALSDLCERLRNDTAIHLEAGRSVADEK